MSKQLPPPPPILNVEDLNQLLLFQGETLSVITFPSQKNETYYSSSLQDRDGTCLEALQGHSVHGFRFLAPIITLKSLLQSLFKGNYLKFVTTLYTLLSN